MTSPTSITDRVALRRYTFDTIGRIGDARTDVQRVIFTGWDIPDPTDEQVEARIVAKVQVRELADVANDLAAAFIVDRPTTFA